MVTTTATRRTGKTEKTFVMTFTERLVADGSCTNPTEIIVPHNAAHGTTDPVTDLSTERTWPSIADRWLLAVIRDVERKRKRVCYILRWDRTAH